MRERPILFSAPMVRAILDGQKTQTRRIVKPQPLEQCAALHFISSRLMMPRDEAEIAANSPYGVRGDRLWVRETWCSPGPSVVGYAADGACGAFIGDGNGEAVWMPHGFILEASGYQEGFKEPARTWGLNKYGGRWRPSIHMPRWASRITLEIISARVERVQAISERDCYAEGVPGHDICGVHSGPQVAAARQKFAKLWDSINGNGAWAANPFVLAVEFRRLRGAAQGVA